MNDEGERVGEKYRWEENRKKVVIGRCTVSGRGMMLGGLERSIQ